MARAAGRCLAVLLQTALVVFDVPLSGLRELAAFDRNYFLFFIVGACSGPALTALLRHGAIAGNKGRLLERVCAAGLRGRLLLVLSSRALQVRHPLVNLADGRALLSCVGLFPALVAGSILAFLHALASRVAFAASVLPAAALALPAGQVRCHGLEPIRVQAERIVLQVGLILALGTAPRLVLEGLRFGLQIRRAALLPVVSFIRFRSQIVLREAVVLRLGGLKELRLPPGQVDGIIVRLLHGAVVRALLGGGGRLCAVFLLSDEIILQQASLQY